MPKILDNVKENALAEAERVLLSEGYRALTVRGVAEALGIGVGTLYNYFPSKDHLVAGVMLRNWMAAIRGFAEEGQYKEPGEVIRRLFDIVQSFAARYEQVWSQYAEHADASKMLRQYHTVLVRQLSGYIEEVMPKDEGPWLPDFLAELVLHFAPDGVSGYGVIEKAVEKLLEP